MAELSDERIELQIIEAGALQARVRVRLRRGELSATAAVRGCLYGPRSELAETVPVRHPLTDCSTAEMLVGEAVIPEPCYTSTELPLYYEVRLEIHDQERVECRTIRLELRPTRPPKLL